MITNPHVTQRFREESNNYLQIYIHLFGFWHQKMSEHVGLLIKRSTARWWSTLTWYLIFFIRKFVVIRNFFHNINVSFGIYNNFFLTFNHYYLGIAVRLRNKKYDMRKIFNIYTRNLHKLKNTLIHSFLK